MDATKEIDKKKIPAPKLRFKGIQSGWKNLLYGDIYTFYPTNSFSRDNLNYESGEVKNIHYGDIHTRFATLFDIQNEEVPFVNSEIDIKKIKDESYCQEKDLVIADASEDYADIGKTIELVNLNNEKIIAGLHTFLARPNKYEMAKGFAGYLVQSWKFRKQVMIIAQGTKVLSLSTGRLANLKLDIPTLPEQQKIASFLSAIDKKMQQLTRKKELLEQYKKGVMQQLFLGKVSFKDEYGKAFPKWEDRKLEDMLFEHKLNSTGKEEVYSVSVHKGLINQIEHLGRVFAAKNTDNYNLVKPNDVIYTKSPTGNFPLGIIKQSKVDKDVIVSPLYGVFTPETPGLGYMLNVYFETPLNVKNYLSSIIQKGAKNTINITNATFLSKRMKLPVSKVEQQKIGDYLLNIDLKIENVSSLITQNQTFKKGLLQQMFV
ncbi:hypothetical protein CAP36_15725 [Chitinophagaceae bacterium IBVUCB2]|nr:hypothetical protein CAP36_15725 [Chitinophagaceae bacterium IBVUCB2]